MPGIRRGWTVLIISLAALLIAQAAASFEVEKYVSVNRSRIDFNTIEYSYKLHISNPDGDAFQVTARLVNPPPGLTILDGELSFGAVQSGATVVSDDTFTVVSERRARVTFDEFQWEFESVDRADAPLLELEQFRRVSATVINDSLVETTYQGRLKNFGAQISNATANIVTVPASMTVVDGNLSFGALGTDEERLSEDTFVVQHAPRQRFFPADIEWDIQFELPNAGSEAAVAQTQTLDGVGLPLGEVNVVEVTQSAASVASSEPETGLVTLGQGGGDFIWRFDKENFLPVWRKANVVAGEVTLLHSPWLAARNPTQYPVSVLNGGTIGDPDEWITVSYPAGAVPANTNAQLTELNGQSLPGLLPAGYSPLNAFWLEFGGEPIGEGTAHLRLMDKLLAQEVAVFAQWDEQDTNWRVLEIISGDDGERYDVAVPGSGAYVVVVADVLPVAPPSPVIGEALAPASAMPPLPETLSGVGSVNPPVSTASIDPNTVTAEAMVEISHDEPLSSGLVLRTEIDERYVLNDASEQRLARFSSYIVGYQRPGDRDPRTLQARFPMRPRLLLGPEELREADISAQILTPEAFQGGVIGSAGGRVAQGGIVIDAEPGVFPSDTPIELRELDITNFLGLAGAFESVLAFELLFTNIVDGRALVALFPDQIPDSSFLLARVISRLDQQGLQPIARYSSDAAGELTFLESLLQPQLGGIDQAGQYVLVKVDAPLTLVEGTARDTGGTLGDGLLVRIDGSPWLAVTDENGVFIQVSTGGSTTVVVTDPVTGDRGTAVVDVGAGGALVDINTVDTGPRVVSILPENNATNVDAVTPVQVTLSEPIVPASLGSAGLVLRAADGSAVEASLSLNLAGTQIDLLPTVPLDYSTAYTVELTTAIRDANGNTLEGANQFAFTTEAQPTRQLGAQLISHEPGSNTEECADVPGFQPGQNGISCVYGTSGAADAEVPVIIINETTGETATVLSKPDGSFKSFINADVDDFLRATFVNANDTRVTLPLNRQLFDDGGIALFEGGGILEAENEEAGNVQVLVEPGSIPGKTKFNLESVGLAEILAAVGNVPPEGGQVLGSGLRVSIEGDIPTESPDVRFPIDVNALDLEPGETVEDVSFALTVPRERDGTTAYELIDKMELAFDDEGNPLIETRSFPFLGMLAALAAASAANTAATTAFLALPIALAKGPTATISGRVLSAQFDASGPMTDTEKPVAGATVSLNNGFTIGSGRRGRLKPGVVFATSRANGFYALRVPVAPFVVRNEANAVGVQATHPFFAQRSMTYAVNVGNAVELFFDDPKANIYFQVGSILPESSVADRSPPTALVSNLPLRPTLDTTAVLNVVATDNRSQPTIDIEVLSARSLVSGEELNAAQVVTLQNQTGEAQGATGRRESAEVSVTGSEAVLVELQLTVSDQAGLARVISHTILFGAAELQVDNPPPPDPNDASGPIVINSLPQDSGIGHPIGAPIRLTFNEVVGNELTADLSWLTVSPQVGQPRVERTPDGSGALIYLPNLEAGQTYTLTVGTGVKDLAGNDFDQDPATPNVSESFVLSFATEPYRGGSFDEIEYAGGAVTLGNYAFVLERAGQLDGAVVVFDLTDPTAPVKVGELSVPGFPRDLALIGRYSYVQDEAAITGSGTSEIKTKPLLAVAGGELGGEISPQYLWVIDVSNPTNPVRVASTAVALTGTTAVTKIEWDAPYLVYLEANAEQQSVNYVNLQKFILGLSIPESAFPQLPKDATPGVDANGDGDYVDEGDTLPLPARIPLRYSGWEFARGVMESNQRITDFNSVRAGGLLAVGLRSGLRLHTSGPNIGKPNPDDPVAAQYRTLRYGDLVLEADLAALDLPHDPKRVTALGQALVGEGDDERLADLVLVSMPLVDNEQQVIIVDIIDPLAPQIISRIGVPDFHGSLRGAQFRDDGLVELAARNNVIVLDPVHLGFMPELPNPNDAVPLAQHPATLGIISNAGSGARTFGSSAAGIHVAALGSKKALVQTAPQMGFVAFPNRTPFDPESTLPGMSYDELESLLEDLQLQSALQPSRVKGNTYVPSTLQPASAVTHYYVLVNAPGGAGETIDLALESLNRNTYPLAPKGVLFPPVHAIGEDALSDLDLTPEENEPAVSALTARRLSDDPISPFFNVYLSKPFTLVYEGMSTGELDDAVTSLDRKILWSGHWTRVSLDPSMADNAAIGAYASEVDTDELVTVPGPHSIVASLGADCVMGPNPPPISTAVYSPESFGMLSPHNGEMLAVVDDLTLRGRKMHFTFRRFNAGQSLCDGIFGRGWDFNYNQRLTPLDANVFPQGSRMPLVVRASAEESELLRSRDLLWHNGSGRTLGYSLYLNEVGEIDIPDGIANDPLAEDLGWTADAERFYLPHQESGIFSFIARMPTGEFVMLDPDGTQRWFRADGRLQTIYDKYEDNRTGLNYNERDELIRIDLDNGGFVEFGYWRKNTDPLFDSDLDKDTSNAKIRGRVARIADHTNRDILFYYTDDGLLERREGPEITDGGPTGYTGRPKQYYISSNDDEPEQTANSIIGIAQGQNNQGSPYVLAQSVGGAGRDVVSQLGAPSGTLNVTFAHTNEALSLDSETATSAVSGNEANTEYTFDKYARAKAVKTGSGETLEAKYTYENGLVKSIEHPGGRKTTYTYDVDNESFRSRGNLTGIEIVPAADGGGETFSAEAQYDERYNMPNYRTDFEGRVYQHIMVDDGRNIGSIGVAGESEKFFYNNYGQLREHQRLNGITATYGFDANTGFVTSKTEGSTSTGYGYSGNPGLRGTVTTLTEGGLVADFTYNERNDLILLEHDGTPVVERGYDEDGNEVKTITMTENGSITETREYDEFGFMREYIVEAGDEMMTTTYEPDNERRIKKVTYPSGVEHNFTYDKLGRLIRWAGGVDEVYVETREYDATGRLEVLNEGLSSYKHEYDGHDRLKAIVDEFGTRTEYDYDKVGNLLGMRIKSAGDDGDLLQEATYMVDDLNRYRKVTLTGTDDDAVMKYDYSDLKITVTDALGAQSISFFDNAGRLDSVEHPNEQYDLGYDNSSFMTSVNMIDGLGSASQTRTYDSVGNVTNIAGNGQPALDFSVGSFGEPKTRTGRGGGITTYGITDLGQFDKITTPENVLIDLEFDSAQRLDKVTDAAGNSIDYDFDQNGILNLITQPNNQQTEFKDFDGNGCPQSISMPGFVSVEQTFDSQCRMLTRTINGPGSPIISEEYSYDGIGRMLSASKSIPGFPASTEYRYDLLGYTRQIDLNQNALSHQFQQRANKGGYRTSITYPSGIVVTSGRDTTGRMTSLVPSAPTTAFDSTSLIDSVAYVGEDRFSSRTLAGGNIIQTLSYDQARQISSMRYTNSDGDLLAEARYSFNDAGRQGGRQYVHHHGRADFFVYDQDLRLTAAHHGARPSVPDEAERQFPGFVTDIFKAGWYARGMSYDNTNNIIDASLTNPDNLEVPPFADNYGGKDSLLATLIIDNLPRLPDAVGNIKKARVYPLPIGPGGVDVRTADLQYNALGELDEVIRDDGCQIRYLYGTTGLMIRRTVMGGGPSCEPVDEDLVWDGGNLAEIRALPTGMVKARFYYGDMGDELLAADIRSATGDFERYFYLSDASRSVMAIADSSGNVIERVLYDVWGMPRIQARDERAPRARRIEVKDGHLLVQFSEPVLPPISESPSTAFVSMTADVDGLIVVESGGEAITGTVRFDESLQPFGTTFRFVPDGELPSTATVTVAADGVVDAWGNANPEAQFNLASTTDGTVAVDDSAPADTAPELAGRSLVNSPFLFHGQFFDADAGLYYMRARWYDPGTGLFLARDRAGMEDSVNLYAGFDNDPVNRRDPTGFWSFCNLFSDRDCDVIGQELKDIGSQATLQKDGYFGVAVGLGISAIGGILDLGTGTAQGLEIAGNPREGPRGMVDLYRGGKLILQDAQMLALATGSVQGLGAIARTTGGALGAAGRVVKSTPTYGRAKAYAISGRQYLRDQLLQRSGLKSPTQILTDYYGLTLAEARAFTSVVKETGVNVSFRVGNELGKLRYRQKWVDEGVLQKPFGVYAKTGPDSIVFFEPKSAFYVSDVDLWDITDAAGVPLSNSSLKNISKRINNEYIINSFGRTNIPIQHMPQMQAARNLGGSVEGFTKFAPKDSKINYLGYSKIEKIGHPGHTVSIYSNKPGNVIVNRNPGWQIDRQIQRTHVQHYKSQLPGALRLYPSPLGLDAIWSGWKP